VVLNGQLGVPGAAAVGDFQRAFEQVIAA